MPAAGPSAAAPPATPSAPAPVAAPASVASAPGSAAPAPGSAGPASSAAASSSASSPTSSTASTPPKKDSFIKKALQGRWIDSDGRAAKWRTDTTSPKKNVKGWVRNKGTKNPMKVGLAMDVKAKKKDAADELLADMPGKNDAWYVPKGKIPVAYWDAKRKP